MKQALELKKKIAFVGLSPALEAALREQLSSYPSFEIVAFLPEDSPPDAVVTSVTDRGYAACPVIVTPPDRCLRLGTLLRQIAQALAEPSLYMDDMPIGNYLFNPSMRTLTDLEGKIITLTDRESDILVYLLRRQGAPAGRDEMLKSIWRYQDGIDTHTLETHIYRLRQKIEISADSPQLLITDGGGYKLASKEENT